MKAQEGILSNLERPVREFKADKDRDWKSPILSKKPLNRKSSWFFEKQESMELENPYPNPVSHNDNNVSKTFNCLRDFSFGFNNDSFDEVISDFNFKPIEYQEKETECVKKVKYFDEEEPSVKIRNGTYPKKPKLPRREYLSDCIRITETKKLQKRIQKLNKQRHVGSSRAVKKLSIAKRIKRNKKGRNKNDNNRQIQFQMKVFKLAMYWNKQNSLLPSIFKLFLVDRESKKKPIEYHDYSLKGLCHHYEVNTSKQKGELITNSSLEKDDRNKLTEQVI